LALRIPLYEAGVSMKTKRALPEDGSVVAQRALLGQRNVSLLRKMKMAVEMARQRYQAQAENA
jgi:hypothetical protein